MPSSNSETSHAMCYEKAQGNEYMYVYGLIGQNQ